MTHDELLEIIDTIQNTINANKVYARKGFDALRAVVELHKPKATIRGYRCKFDDEKFPCRHHQAIEKELK